MILFILSIFLLLLILVALVAIYFHYWQTHAITTTIMYLFFMYLWFVDLTPDSNIKPHCSFPLFLITIYITPLYFIYHLFCIKYAKHIEDKTIMTINIIGTGLCALNLIIFFTF